MGNASFFDPLPRDRKPFFKILPDFCHRSDQIYHKWKSPLGDPLFILPSIYFLKQQSTSTALLELKKNNNTNKHFLLNYSMADSIGSQSGTSDEYHSMTDSLGSRPGTSDEYHDPFCEPCEESRGRNVKIECFCKNCNQYLCFECHTTHGSLKATRGHVIQTGDEMPKSMADKPPRYDACDDHPKHLKDQFCCDHGTLVCSTCCSTSHAMCNTKSVADTCQYIQQSEIDTIRDVNKTYKSQLLKFLSSMDKHGKKLT